MEYAMNPGAESGRCTFMTGARCFITMNFVALAVELLAVFSSLCWTVPLLPDAGELSVLTQYVEDGGFGRYVALVIGAFVIGFLTPSSGITAMLL